MSQHIRRIPLFTFALALLAVGVWCGPDGVTSSLEYERAAVQNGQVHRLLTCHLTHFTAGHLAWDVLGFCVLGALCERRGRRELVATLGLAGVLVAVAVHLLAVDLQSYRGLSGLVSASFGLAVMGQLLRSVRGRDFAAASFMGGLLVLFGVYVVGQGVSRQTLVPMGGAEAFVAVPLAHLAGLLCGVAVAGVAGGRRERRSPADPRSFAKARV